MKFSNAASPVPLSKILLIDDNVRGLNARRTVLEEQGYATATATSGEDGIEQFATGHFDLVVTDYKMPRMNGGIAWNEYIRLLEQASPITGHAMRVYNLMRMGQVPIEMLIERILGFEKKLLFCFLTEASK